MNGFVYFFRQSGTDYVKIGMTNGDTIETRFSHFKMYAPNGAEVVGFISTDNARGLEKELHRRFKHKRLRGEFFELSQQEIDIILNQYQGDRENELRTYFEILISNKKISVAIIKEAITKTILKFSGRNIDDSETKINIIVSFVENNFKGEHIAASDVQMAMMDQLGAIYGFKEIGMAMKTKWIQKSKRDKGKVRRLYHII